MDELVAWLRCAVRDGIRGVPVGLRCARDLLCYGQVYPSSVSLRDLRRL